MGSQTERTAIETDRSVDYHLFRGWRQTVHLNHFEVITTISSSSLVAKATWQYMPTTRWFSLLTASSSQWGQHHSVTTNCMNTTRSMMTSSFVQLKVYNATWFNRAHIIIRPKSILVWLMLEQWRHSTLCVFLCAAIERLWLIYCVSLTSSGALRYSQERIQNVAVND